MKKISYYSLALAVAATSLFSCRKNDVVAPTVVQENNQPRGTANINFSVHVVPSSAKGRAEALTGAVVTVSQGAFKSTQTVDENGMAVFSGLYEGEATVFVKAAGHASWNGKYFLSSGIDLKTTSASHTIGVASIVPLPRLAGEVSGSLVANTDPTATVSTVVPVNGANVRVQYGTQSGSVGSGAGAFLTSGLIEPNYYITTTDASGNYSFTGLPEADANVEASFIGQLASTGNRSFTWTFSQGVTPTADKKINLGTGAMTTPSATATNGSVTGKLQWNKYKDTTGGQPQKLEPVVTSSDLVVYAELNSTPGSTISKSYNISTSNGDFTLNNLPAGSYSIKGVYTVVVKKGNVEAKNTYSLDFGNFSVSSGGFTNAGLKTDVVFY